MQKQLLVFINVGLRYFKDDSDDLLQKSYICANYSVPCLD